MKQTEETTISDERSTFPDGRPSRSSSLLAGYCDYNTSSAPAGSKLELGLSLATTFVCITIIIHYWYEVPLTCLLTQRWLSKTDIPHTNIWALWTTFILSLTNYYLHTKFCSGDWRRATKYIFPFVDVNKQCCTYFPTYFNF